MKNLILKYGLIYGVIFVTYRTLALYGVISILFYTIITLLVSGLFLWLSGNAYKRINNGYATSEELGKVFFRILAMGTVMLLVFNLIHHNVITEETKKVLVEIQYQSGLDFMDSLEMNEDNSVIERNYTIQTSMEKLFGFSSLIANFIEGILTDVAFALLGAAIFKKVPKENIA